LNEGGGRFAEPRGVAGIALTIEDTWGGDIITFRRSAPRLGAHSYASNICFTADGLSIVLCDGGAPPSGAPQRKERPDGVRRGSGLGVGAPRPGNLLGRPVVVMAKGYLELQLFIVQRSPTRPSPWAAWKGPAHNWSLPSCFRRFCSRAQTFDVVIAMVRVMTRRAALLCGGA